MSASELVVRVGPLAPLAVSALYVAVAGLLARLRRRRVRKDRQRGRAARATVVARASAGEPARLLAERARTNALFHP